MCFVLNLKQRSSLHAAAPSGSRYVNRKGGEGMSESDLALGYEAKRDLCVKLEKQLTAVTAERDRYRKALEDAANSLFTIANSAGKDELMSDMLSVRGYANSRGTVVQQALARKDEPVVSSPGSDGYWWMLDTHLPVRWELVRVSGKKNVFRVESQTEIQPPRCCAKWVKVREPEGR